MFKLKGTHKKEKASVMLLLSTSLLVSACGGNNNDNAASNPAPGSSPASSVAASEPIVELTAWDLPSADDPSKAVAEQLFSEFEQMYPNIKVNHIAPPQGTNDREVFVTSMAGGSGPDVYSNAAFDTIGEWAKNDLVLDLTEYWNGYAEKDQFIPSSLEAAKVGDKIYGVPYEMYVTGMIWNKTMFEEAGLDPNQPPANWDELVEYGKKLTAPDQKKHALTLLGMEWADWWFQYYVWQAGGDLTQLNDDGTVTLQLTSEPVVTALQFYKDLRWTHKIVQSNVVQSYEDDLNDFYQGRSAMTRGGSVNFGEYAANGLDISKIGFAPYPAGPSGESPSQVGGRYWIINPQISKAKQDAAWKYIMFMSSKEAHELYLQFALDNGLFPNLLSVRNDVNPLDYTDGVPQDLIDGVNKAAENTRLEYYLKATLSPYVVKAIQEALIDEGADPLELLQKAQDAAQKEVVDPYNASLTK